MRRAATALAALLLSSLLSGCAQPSDVPVLARNTLDHTVGLRLWANDTAPPWSWTGAVPANQELRIAVLHVAAGRQAHLVAAPAGLPTLETPIGGEVQGVSVWVDANGAHLVKTLALGAKGT